MQATTNGKFNEHMLFSKQPVLLPHALAIICLISSTSVITADDVMSRLDHESTQGITWKPRIIIKIFYLLL